MSTLRCDLCPEPAVLDLEGVHVCRRHADIVRPSPVVAECSCGRRYSLAGWRLLRLLGVADLEIARFEQRLCRCNSTISRKLAAPRYAVAARRLGDRDREERARRAQAEGRVKALQQELARVLQVVKGQCAAAKCSGDYQGAIEVLSASGSLRERL